MSRMGRARLSSMCCVIRGCKIKLRGCPRTTPPKFQKAFPCNQAILRRNVVSACMGHCRSQSVAQAF